MRRVCRRRGGLMRRFRSLLVLSVLWCLNASTAERPAAMPTLHAWVRHVVDTTTVTAERRRLQAAVWPDDDQDGRQWYWVGDRLYLGGDWPEGRRFFEVAAGGLRPAGAVPWKYLPTADVQTALMATKHGTGAAFFASGTDAPIGYVLLGAGPVV